MSVFQPKIHCGYLCPFYRKNDTVNGDKIDGNFRKRREQV